MSFSRSRRACWATSLAAGLIATVALLASGGVAQTPLDPEADAWVSRTLAGMTLDEQIGQLITPSFFSTYTSSDSDAYDELVQLVREYHVGGFLVFGGRERAPVVLLNPTYGTITLGQPLAAASMLNRLQAIATVPLLNAADFEAGVGFRLAGATTFPRAMAFGATGDARLAFEAGRVTAVEARAIGIHLNFAPVVDVNNNPHNPVINTRSFGEDPAAVGALAAAYVRGLHVGGGGMLATLKHFPGHGDTDVDSHVGLPIITHPRDRLSRVEWPPFRAGIAAGADAVMTGHIQLPALDPAPGTPATLSLAVVTGGIRQALGFEGLIYTDGMRMGAITDLMSAGEAAVRAIAAGNDVVLHSPDPAAAFESIRAAVEAGAIGAAQVRASAERMLRAKARVNLHRIRAVDLESIPTSVGGRAHAAVAERVSARAMTLIADERHQIPLDLPLDARVLYLSVLDRPSGWRIAAPSRTFIPELTARWPNVTAIELSNQTPPASIDLVRRTADRYDAIVASIFVRTTPRPGGMDLAPPLTSLLEHLVDATAARGQPFATVLFGSPYTAVALADLPAMLVTYDLYDQAERSAVRALAGETAIGGRLPVRLSEAFPVGHGLTRTASRVTPP